MEGKTDDNAAPIATVSHDEDGEQLTDLELVKHALLEGDVTLELDPGAIARRIVEEIITAPTTDEAFKERPVWHAQETPGTPFLLRGVRWFPSGLGEGPSVFAAVDVVNLNTGEVGVLTTSAYKQLAKLYVLARDDAFPRRVMNTQSLRPTAGGYYPLDFEDAPEAPEES